jgi:cysteinyl-tRNA synthetase
LNLPEKSTGVTSSPRTGVLSFIGNTPLVPIRSINPNPQVEILAKLERSNPGGSVKDRIGLWMIEEGERTGELTHDKVILEATSGNTGIGLAMVAATKGYKLVLAMSEGVSVERRKILAAYGAEFMLTPAEQGTDGAIEKAYALAGEQSGRYFLSDQYNNPANVLAHYHETAPEIWAQTQGRITHFVAAMGTTGTLMGCSRRFRELNPRIRVIGVEPYLGHRLQGLKNLKEAYVPGIYDASALDQKVNIEDDAAWDMTRRLARDEGLLVGMSSGAAMHVAAELAKQIESGVIVVLFPDGGERYLSTPLFSVAQPESPHAKLHLMNSLTKHYEAFRPVADGSEVKIYSCGPTVHRRPHLGVLRRMVVDDLLRRTLEFAGHAVKQVVSITDVDDMTVREAEKTGTPLGELCRKHEAEFHEDVRALRVKPADTYVRSSESVEQMIALTRELVARGYAYERYHSVYFNVVRLKSYGELLGKQALVSPPVGEIVDQDRYDGLDPRDFILFRRSDLAEMRKGLSFKTEWGNVRPSWHVQCSAMARAHLGDSFDIHTGSVDLIFPHHENEMAQIRALTGQSSAKVWLHCELVLVDGVPMTYDGDAYVTLPHLRERGHRDRDVRFAFLQTHYRQPLHITAEKLAAAHVALSEIDALVKTLAAVAMTGPSVPEVVNWINKAKTSVTKALFDDLDAAGAIAALCGLVNQVTRLNQEHALCREDADKVMVALRDLDRVFGILPEVGEPAAS